MGPRVLGLCAVVGLTDIVYGMFGSTFSVYASLCGANVESIGLINTAGGFVLLGTSLPLGLVADRIGRSRMVACGVAVFVALMVLLAFACGAWALWTGRILFALGNVAVFQVGNALLGDLTRPEQRNRAFGLYSTCMGLGFGLGPYLGGILTDRFGHATAYLCASAVGVVALGAAVRTFSVHPWSAPGERRPKVPLLAGFHLIFGKPDLLLVTFANLLAGLTFAGTITTFLPLYGQELRLSATTVGTMFALRSGISAFGRLPSAFVSDRFGNIPVMVIAMLADIALMFGIFLTRDPSTIMVLLALDGLAGGGFVVAGQTYVQNHTNSANRGATGAVYSMASAFSSTVSPFFLALVAQRWGLNMVFASTGAVLAAGFAVFAGGNLWLRSRRVSRSLDATFAAALVSRDAG